MFLNYPDIHKKIKMFKIKFLDKIQKKILNKILKIIQNKIQFYQQYQKVE